LFNLSKISRFGLSILSGILLTIAFPYTGSFTFLVFIAWIPLLLVEDDISKHRYRSSKVFTHAYLSFLIFNVGTTYWVWYASPGGAYMAFTLNALLMAIAFFFFHFAKKKLGPKIGYLSFIIIWLGFEHIHFYWELSWPWLTMGNYFSITPSIVQWYSITGVLGGSLWVLLVNYIGFRLVADLWIKRKSVKSSIYLSSVYLPLLLLPITCSLIMYYNYEEVSNPYEVVVVQPNIDPYFEKFEEPVEIQLEKLMNLATENSTASTQLILAPETAIPFGFLEDNVTNLAFYKNIQSQLKPFNASFLIGAITYKYFNERHSAASRMIEHGEYYEVYNSSMHIQNSKSPEFIHKSKLVLGVEKVPFIDWFPFLEQFSIDQGGSSGTMGIENEPKIFDAKGVKIAPVVCYESIYGEFAAAQCNKGAQLIGVITNDGWWQDTPGYKQHMSFSRLRAIENRRSVARSANTGISCFINQRGDVIKQTEWWKPACIRATLNLNDKKTIFTLTGDLIGRIAFYCSVLLLLFLVLKWAQKYFVVNR